MATGAQEQCEPRAMLLATAPDARALLRSKVLGSMRIMVLLELPVLIGATIFQPDWWWIHGLFGLGMLVLVAYAVLLKYANYRPNERLIRQRRERGRRCRLRHPARPAGHWCRSSCCLSEVRNARENLNTYFHAHHR
jgi:type IV secretory pathway TrbD component